MATITMPTVQPAISRSVWSESLKARCADSMRAVAQRDHAARGRTGAAVELAAEAAVVASVDEGEGVLAAAAGLPLLVGHPARL